MFAWWAKNSIAANLLMAIILVAGVLAYNNIAREVTPTLSLTRVSVTVAWPGAAPQEVEDQILLKMEESLRQLDDIQELRATAEEGAAYLSIDAEAQVDMLDFVNRVKQRVDAVNNLPQDAFPPQVRQVEMRDPVIGVGLYGDVSEQTISRMGKMLRDELSLLPSVGVVALMATRDEEVSISISEESLRRYNLTFDEVAASVRNNSINLSSGSIRTDTGNVQLRTDNLADTQNEFEAITVRQTEDGAVIRIGDVATVIDGFEDVELEALLNDQRGALLMVQSYDGMDVVEMSESVRTFIDERSKTLPGDLKMNLWWDSSDAYHSRIKTIGGSAFYGIVLVMIVLVLFLRPAVAFWVSLGIATAFTGAFIFLPANDISLNMLSLFAFLMVIGVIVDDAIIVGESIYAETEKGKRGVDAAISGVHLVAKPVIFAVLTTMIAFAPFLFLSGEAVQMTRQISLIIIFALTFSLIEALLILPAHLAHLKEPTHTSRFSKVQSRIADSIVDFAKKRYQPLAVLAIKNRYVTVASFFMLLSVAMTLTTSGWIKFGFFPPIESEFLQLTVEMPDGSPFSRMQEVRDQIADAQFALAEELNSKAGKTIVNTRFVSIYGGGLDSYTTLAPPEDRGNISSKAIAERWRELVGDIPDAEKVDIMYTFTGGGPGLDVVVSAADFDELRASVEDIKQELATFGEVYDIQDDIESSSDELRLALKPGAERLGLTIGEVSRQVRQAFYGEEAQRLPRTGGDVRVMVRYPKETRSTIASLNDFRVRTADGREIPLSAVADISFAPSVKSIERLDGMRSATVTARVREGGDSRRILTDLKENFFPDWSRAHPGASHSLGGEAEQEAEFFSEIMTRYVIALFVMYALIAVAFRSYWQPLLIMTAIPFGFTGAVFGHFVMDMSLSMFSYLGIGAAAGVVVNDNLVLVDYVNRLRAKGMGALQALAEAGTSRFRPIILTSLTTFIGLMPMMAEQSTQAQALKPAVVSLAYGILFSTTVTLILVPALYAVGVDIARGFRGFWTGRRQPGFGKGASDASGLPAE